MDTEKIREPAVRRNHGDRAAVPVMLATAFDRSYAPADIIGAVKRSAARAFLGFRHAEGRRPEPGAAAGRA